MAIPSNEARTSDTLSKKLTAVGMQLETLTKKMSEVDRTMSTRKDRSEAIQQYNEERSSSIRGKAKSAFTEALLGKTLGGLVNKKREIGEREQFLSGIEDEQKAELLEKEKPLGDMSYGENTENVKVSFEEFKSSIEKVNDSIASMSADNAQILSIVKYIQNRVSPKDVTVASKREGEKSKVRFDPLAPEKAQYTVLSEKGKKTRFASKEEITSASWKIGRMQDQQQPEDEYAAERADLAEASKIDIAAPKEEDPNTKRYEKIIEELKEIKEILNKPSGLGGFFGGLGVGKIVGSLGKIVAKMGAKLLSTLKNALGIGAAKKAGAKATEKVVAREVGEAAAKETAEKVVAKEAGEAVAKEAVQKAATKEVGESAAKEAVETAAKSAGKEVAEKAGEKVSKEVVEKTIKKSVAKVVAKKVPAVGILAGLGFGAWRLVTEGDLTGAAKEVASGVVGTVPGPGTVASLAIDADLVAGDVAKELGMPKQDVYSMVMDELKRQIDNVTKAGEEAQKAEPIPSSESKSETTSDSSKGAPSPTPLSTPTSTPAPASNSLNLSPNIPSAAQTITPNSVGAELDRTSTQVARATTQQVVKPVVINQPAPPAVPVQQSSGDQRVFISLRHGEPALATYRASIFDHPVTHPGIFSM